MARASLHALTWSEEQRLYELYTRGQLKLRFRPGEESAWLDWLNEATSFAFHGKDGSLNVYLEKRPRGGAYWYAYHTGKSRTHKRYLGRTENLSPAHLEETARSLSDEQQPAPATELGTALLSSRLAPPRLPNALVERERLLTALDEALSTRLSLLSASAGWGKTTLLSAWAQRHQGQVAWLSLNELDNSPTRFWVALIAALRRCPALTSSIGESVVTQLQSPQPPPLLSCLSVLLQELERGSPHPAPIVLILDDYQVIEEPNIHQSLAFWIEHLPAHLRLVLSTRVDPDLPLARLRARGELTEIRMDELRFDQEEASQYLSQLLSPVLSPEEVRRLVNRTEGWIAGLHLVALALQKREDRAAYLEALTGSQRYLLDYVQEDILAYLPESVRTFLLHSAILSRLDASVCQAVTASPTAAASQQMLTLLERANLFLVPLDEERRCYRLHDLFREALLSALYTSQPEMVPLLHRRAACFYEAEGEWAEAIAHWFETRDFSAATRLMERTVEQFWVRGEAATIANWVLKLPEPLLREHARLTLTTALHLLHTATQATRAQRESVHRQVRQLIARVAMALRRESDEHPAIDAGAGTLALSEDLEARVAERDVLHRRMRLLSMYMTFFGALASGDRERLDSMQQEIEEELDQDEEAIWQIVPLTYSFLLHFSTWQTGATLLPRLLAAKERLSHRASPFVSLKVRQFLAFVALEAGKLRLASQESQAALDLIEQARGDVLLKDYFEVALAHVWYQWNRLEEARGALHTVMHDASTWQHLDLLGFGYLGLLQIALATANWPLAEFALDGMEQMVQRERFATYPGRLPILRAQWWLARGQIEEASEWAAHVVFPQGTWEASLYHAFPVVIRVYFAEQRWTEAAELLDNSRKRLDRPANVRITITYLAQSLVALHQAGQRDQARAVAARLFALTEPEGYLRVYLDEGEPMRQALLAFLPPHSQQHKLASSTTAYISKLLAAFEQEQRDPGRSLVAAPTALSPDRQASVLPSAPDASLTRREQEVLRLLATGASNQDIARTLVIELPTVKKHVSNLLGKLGASSRTQAVSRARALSLL